MNCPFCNAIPASYNSDRTVYSWCCETIKGELRGRPCYERQLAQQAEQIANLQEVLEDKRRLTREIDIIINGTNAAKQASLCDLVHQIRQLTQQADLLKRAMELLKRGVSGEASRSKSPHYVGVAWKEESESLIKEWEEK